jgi:hypothetical protein
VAGDDTIEITDRSTFSDKIRKIESASAALRAFSHDLGAVVDKAREEASSFTATGKPAPIYDDMLSALTDWHVAVKTVITSVCGSADHCAANAHDKFIKITGADDTGAKEVKAVQDR